MSTKTEFLQSKFMAKMLFGAALMFFTYFNLEYFLIGELHDTYLGGLFGMLGASFVCLLLSLLSVFDASNKLVVNEKGITYRPWKLMIEVDTLPWEQLKSCSLEKVGKTEYVVLSLKKGAFKQLARSKRPGQIPDQHEGDLFLQASKFVDKGAEIESAIASYLK